MLNGRVKTRASLRFILALVSALVATSSVSQRRKTNSTRSHKNCLGPGCDNMRAFSSCRFDVSQQQTGQGNNTRFKVIYNTPIPVRAVLVYPLRQRGPFFLESQTYSTNTNDTNDTNKRSFCVERISICRQRASGLFHLQH